MPASVCHHTAASGRRPPPLPRVQQSQRCQLLSLLLLAALSLLQRHNATHEPHKAMACCSCCSDTLPLPRPGIRIPHNAASCCRSPSTSAARVCRACGSSASFLLRGSRTLRAFSRSLRALSRACAHTENITVADVSHMLPRCTGPAYGGRGGNNIQECYVGTCVKAFSRSLRALSRACSGGGVVCDKLNHGVRREVQVSGSVWYKHEPAAVSMHDGGQATKG